MFGRSQDISSNSTTHPAALAADILRSEADHRIANNLALIAGLVRLRARGVVQKPGPIEREAVQALLDDVATRVEMVARLHRMLSQPSQHELIDVGDYLREICASVAASLAGSRVTLSHDANVCLAQPDQALSLGLLIVELMTNAMKYAHPTGVPVKVHVGCRHGADGALILDFADDGIGLPENFDPAVDGGLGFRLMRSLGDQLGASVNFDSSPLGTRFRLEVRAPVHAVAAGVDSASHSRLPAAT